MSPSPGRVGTPVRLWGWLSVVLAAVAVVCLVGAVQALRPSEPRDTPPRAEPADTSSADIPAAGPSATAVPARGSHPVRIRIPAIEVTARVSRLGLNPDRTVEVPKNPGNTGWYKLGPPPGRTGSAVILGHVDSGQGPAVFHRLRYLEPGDRVLVDAVDGSTSTFRVIRLATYPNESFPADEVYASPGRRRLLNLVTCGGEYDPETGYQSNVVVYTRWVRGG